MKAYKNFDTGVVWTEKETRQAAEQFYDEAGYSNPDEYFEFMKSSMEELELGQDKPLTKEEILDLLLEDRYTKKEAERVMSKWGFMVYHNLEEAAEDYEMSLSEIIEIDDIGVEAVTYKGKIFVICNPM